MLTENLFKKAKNNQTAYLTFPNLCANLKKDVNEMIKGNLS